ncbi:methyltransferase domain-containing protein [Actinacidiphila oryziradicis]|uniref:DNA cytosine methyltransferase n=1 Tax=Actinacidiphila oryziradicis TaxID=2571141 RepID=A0A4U0SKK6_9ACTN|nr:DNA cytosine methyltransferase [Actinacidiphila oryziradicis]TKA09528.1 DNA cytosine methyltransferase [Actinacidiphila oryziradicis]
MTQLPPFRRSRRPRVLDAFCCQGGAGKGYHDAGFDVTGIDIAPQPRYPFTFVQGDAVEFIREHGHEFDLGHASPPCQAHTRCQQIQGRHHPDLIDPVRDAFEAADIPYIIENVPGAPLHDPVTLCGAMFGLRTYRHRLFETTFPMAAPRHPQHTARTAKMGRPAREGEFLHIVGNFSGVALARDVMGMPWANRDGLREAIPPAYTRHIGRAFLTSRAQEVAA